MPSLFTICGGIYLFVYSAIAIFIEEIECFFEILELLFTHVQHSFRNYSLYLFSIIVRARGMIAIPLTLRPPPTTPKNLCSLRLAPPAPTRTPAPLPQPQPLPPPLPPTDLPLPPPHCPLPQQDPLQVP